MERHPSRGLTLPNFVKMVQLEMLQSLPCLRPRPPNLYRRNRHGVAQTDLQSEGIGPKTPTTADRPVDFTSATSHQHIEFHPRTHRRAIGLYPHQSQLDPVVGISWIFK